MKICFEKPLQKAIIKERKNRFIFLIEIGGEIVEAHCPATGIILSVFQYDAPPFRPPVNEAIYLSFIEDLKNAKTKGLENWQLNLKITENYVEILQVFRNEYLNEL